MGSFGGEGPPFLCWLFPNTNKASCICDIVRESLWHIGGLNQGIHTQIDDMLCQLPHHLGQVRHSLAGFPFAGVTALPIPTTDVAARAQM